MSLESSQHDVLIRYRQLASKDSFGSRLAGPFFSAAAMGSANAKNRRRVLLVGQATSDSWYAEDFQNSDSVKTWRERSTIRYLRDGVKSTAFWRFASALNTTACEQAKCQRCNGSEYKHLVWTNLAKIGQDQRRPPGARLFAAQRRECRQVLLDEIAEYKPYLVVFATGMYQATFIEEELFDGNDGEGLPPANRFTATGDGDMWFLEKSDQFPAVIWCGHPGGKAKAQLQGWLDKARELLT